MKTSFLCELCIFFFRLFGCPCKNGGRLLMEICTFRSLDLKIETDMLLVIVIARRVANLRTSFQKPSLNLL